MTEEKKDTEQLGLGLAGSLDDEPLHIDEESDLDLDIAQAIEDAENNAEEEKTDELRGTEAERDSEEEDQGGEDEGEEEPEESDEPEGDIEEPEVDDTQYDTSFLTKEEQQRFSSLPPEAKKITSEIAARVRKSAQQWMHAEVQRQAQQIEAQFAGITETLAPFADMFEGSTPEAVVKDALTLADAIEKDPVSTIYDLADELGLDLEIYEGEQPAQRQPSQQTYRTPPELARLEQEIQNLKTQRELERQQAEARQLATAVENFVKETNEDGSPAYPLIEEVGHEVGRMAKLFLQENPQANVRDVLKQAYDTVVYRNPELRARALTSLGTNGNGNGVIKKQKGTSKKKRSSSLQGSSPSSRTVDTEDIPDDIDGTLRKVFREKGL